MDFVWTLVVVSAVAVAVTVLLMTVVRAIVRRVTRRGKPASGGMEMMAQVNGPKGMPEPEGDTIEYVPNTDKMIAYDCGHEGPVDFRYSLFGKEIKTDTDRIRSMHERCPECMVAEMRQDIIRCALCGHFILPGQSVAVYAGGGDIRKKWATRSPDGGYIGCTRRDCCPSGAFFAGHWMGRDGLKPAFEHGCAAAEAFATGKPVFGTFRSELPPEDKN